jgi:hypothetical protein
VDYSLGRYQIPQIGSNNRLFAQCKRSGMRDKAPLFETFSFAFFSASYYRVIFPRRCGVPDHSTLNDGKSVSSKSIDEVNIHSN